MGKLLIINTLCKSLFVYKLSVTVDISENLIKNVKEVIDFFTHLYVSQQDTLSLYLEATKTLDLDTTAHSSSFFVTTGNLLTDNLITCCGWIFLSNLAPEMSTWGVLFIHA